MEYVENAIAPHWEAAKELLPYVFDAAHEFRLDPALILAVMSRESGCGMLLDEHKTGDYAPRSWGNHRLPPDGLGWGRGLMQIDYAAHQFARTGPWRDPHSNIGYGAKVLRDSINYFYTKAADVAEPFRAGIAAYNRGPGNILNDLRDGLDVDEKTAHKNYSRDVLRRAAFFRDRLGEMSDPELVAKLDRLPILPPELLPVTLPEVRPKQIHE